MSHCRGGQRYRRSVVPRQSASELGYPFGRPTKTAVDAMRERTGVCRDFAQLSVTLCRAMNIPARYTSGYLGDIGVSPSWETASWREVSGVSHSCSTRSRSL